MRPLIVALYVSRSRRDTSTAATSSAAASDWVDVSTAYGAFKFTFLLAKLDIVPVAAIGLFTGVKADFVHIKVDVSAVKVANTPLKWGAYTTHLKNAAIAINTSMATIFP